MTYGILASKSCILTDIVDNLHEDSKKVNSVERLTRHLNKGISAPALKSYPSFIRKWVPSSPVIHIDDSDIAKPDGYKFEALVIVRDSSKSSDKKASIRKAIMLRKPVSKEDVINVAETYFSRWRIEEYFRCKKQVFQFENFRVRKLTAINALNFYITLCMAFLVNMSMKPESNALKAAIIKKADPIKEKVYFCHYRIAKGICGILSFAKEGVRLWFRTKRPAYRQLCLRLVS
ncbi:MAG: transposase [Butyrivibrio sp.]|nr:transposase [Butyrivibrio sp.]